MRPRQHFQVDAICFETPHPNTHPAQARRRFHTACDVKTNITFDLHKLTTINPIKITRSKSK